MMVSVTHVGFGRGEAKTVLRERSGFLCTTREARFLLLA